MSDHNLTSSYTGPFPVGVGDIIQNQGTGTVLVCKANVAPSDDSNSLRLGKQNDVVRVTVAGNIFVRSVSATGQLVRVVPAI